MKRIIAFIYLIFCLSTIAEAQLDTIAVKPKLKSIAKRDNPSPNTYDIRDKVFPRDNKYINPFFATVFSSGKEFHAFKLHNKYSYNVYDSLTITHCTLYQPKPNEFFNPDIIPITFHTAVIIQGLNNSGSQYNDYDMQIFDNSFDGSLTITNSHFKTIEIGHSRGYLFFSEDTLNNFRYTESIKDSVYFDFDKIVFYQKQPGINIQSTPIAEFDLNRIKFDNLEISLKKDTITGRFTLNNNYINKTWKQNGVTNINFTNCYINTTILIDHFSKNQRVTFSNCTFGPQASLYAIKSDTLIFEDCQKLPSTLTLSILPNNEQTYFKVINCDFIDVKMFYTENVKMKFPESANTDQVSAIYQSFLDKFKSEGKTDSYQTIDIEFKNYLATRGNFLIKVIDVVNKYWWNYGYSKGRVIGWTLSFLFVFFILNTIIWSALQQVYPISKVINMSEKNSGILGNLRHYFGIFIYTAFIFFSLKVDIGKLHFTSIRLITYFFVQYFTGLICLFFILNAILKI